MIDPMTAYSTLVLAMLSFVAVGISYWGIKRQTTIFALSLSADLSLKLADRFNGKTMLEVRNLAAHALLSKSNLAHADEVFDFFEAVGLYVRKDALDVEFAHSMFFHWINLYWRAGKEYILESRKRTSNLYEDFEGLYKKVLEIEKKQDSESRDINPTDDDIKSFLKQETLSIK